MILLYGEVNASAVSVSVLHHGICHRVSQGALLLLADSLIKTCLSLSNDFSVECIKRRSPSIDFVLQCLIYKSVSASQSSL
jgi:hypothetical protein